MSYWTCPSCKGAYRSDGIDFRIVDGVCPSCAAQRVVLTEQEIVDLAVANAGHCIGCDFHTHAGQMHASFCQEAMVRFARDVEQAVARRLKEPRC